MADKKNILFYDNWLMIIKSLPQLDSGILIQAIASYKLEHIKTEIKDSSLNAIYEMMISSIDSDCKRYEEVCEKNRKNGSLGGKQKVANATDRHRPPQSVAILPDMDMDIDIDKGKEKRFIAPTLEEVKAYCHDRQNGVDAERFFDYYQSINWMRGKSKIKDWKACVRTWESKNKDIKKELITKDKALEGNREIKDIFDDCQENYPPELCSNNDFEYFLKAIASDSLEESKGKAIKIKLMIRNLKEFNKPFQEVIIC